MLTLFSNFEKLKNILFIEEENKDIIFQLPNSKLKKQMKEIINLRKFYEFKNRFI
jgi:hypothetical protein